LSGTVAIANGGTGSTTAAAARTALGLGTAATVSTGTSGATIPLLSTANTWTLAQAFTIRPTFNGNTPYDTGNLTIGNYLTTATAASTYATIAQATTALAATGGSINGVTVGLSAPLAGAFSTLSASGNDALLYSNSSAQSIPNNAATTVTGWTKVYDRLSINFNASTGVFTAPSAGFYHVDVAILFASTANVAATFRNVTIVVNGTSLIQGLVQVGTAATYDIGVVASGVVQVTAGQTIVIQALQTNGASVALSSSALNTYLSIQRVP
jgi:hypothetical protein